MKKFAFLALLLFFYYIAGMYDSPVLMILFLTQIFLMAVMFCLKIYLKRNLTVSFAEHMIWAEKDGPVLWKLRIENRGRLPVSKFLLSLSIKRRGAAKILKRRTRGSGDTGIRHLVFQDTAVSGACGIYVFRMDSLKVFDYLSLFSGKKKMKNEMTVIVFPRRYEMRLDWGMFSRSGDEAEDKNNFAWKSSYGEIRQIREYHPGDPVRHIHWNQTARTGQVWVKDYEEEHGGRIRLLLDLNDQKKSSFDEDSFFTLVYALLSALIRKNFVISVFWRMPEKTELREMEVRDDLRCRELLVQMYQVMETLTERQNKACEAWDPGTFFCEEGDVRITADLSWFIGDRLIYRFSKENLAEELTQKYFTGDSI